MTQTRSESIIICDDDPQDLLRSREDKQLTKKVDKKKMQFQSLNDIFYFFLSLFLFFSLHVLVLWRND